MAVMGVGNVNKKLKRKDAEGVPNWKKVLYGKIGEEAHRAQMNHGRLLKAKEESKKTLAKRKLRKVTA